MLKSKLFKEVELDSYFRFTEEGTSLQKTSPFGYTDPLNKMYGEQQIIFVDKEVFTNE